MGDEVVAGQGHELVHEVTPVNHLDVLLEKLLLVRVDVDHCRVEQTSGEPGHVRNGAIDEEFFDDLLIREDFTEPECQSDVIF